MPYAHWGRNECMESRNSAFQGRQGDDVRAFAHSTDASEYAAGPSHHPPYERTRSTIRVAQTAPAVSIVPIALIKPSITIKLSTGSCEHQKLYEHSWPIHAFGTLSTFHIPCGTLFHCPVLGSSSCCASAQACRIRRAFLSDRGRITAGKGSGMQTKPCVNLSGSGKMSLPSVSFAGKMSKAHISLTMPKKRLRSATCMPWHTLLPEPNTNTSRLEGSGFELDSASDRWSSL